MWSLRATALVAAALAATVSLQGVAESRLLDPTTVNVALQANPHQLRRATAATQDDDLETKIQSYFAGSGFPIAGRSLQQKIDEANAFLNDQLPKTGAVGVGVSVVYQDNVVISSGYGLRRFNDSSSSVTPNDLFQIGSVSKTFIALGVGLLVDDSKLKWTDPVKKHIPWLKLFDKYAEEHVRVGDLLSMNSGLGRQPDLAIFAGVENSTRGLLEALEFAEPEFSLRETPAYANINFEILGQLIEEVSGKPWPAFLRERLWTPLGMNHTFAAVEDVPAELQVTALNAGHLVCEKNVRGPFAMVNEPYTKLSPGTTYLASGSIVSSAADIATVLRLVLNKGVVDGEKLFQSPKTISKMITGKNVATVLSAQEAFHATGVDFFPDGDSFSAGYGFDLIGKLMWGHAYLQKDGDTYVHHATTAYAPNDRLAVAILSNSEGDALNFVDQARSYVMGIFLDVPKDMLVWQFQKWQRLLPPPSSPMPGVPACGFTFWENPPRLTISPADMDALVGEYAATVSPAFFPRATIAAGAEPNSITFRLGGVTASMFYVGDIAPSKVFLATTRSSYAFETIAATPDGDRFVLDFGPISYRKA